MGARACGGRGGDGERRASGVLARRARGRDSGAPSDGRVPALRGPIRAARSGADPGDLGATRRRRPSRAARVAEPAQPGVRVSPLRPARGLTDRARPGLDAAVLRLRPSLRGLALSLDGQGRIAALDPYIGGALAILEAARNVACVGGEPLGFTDCLNFGNPEKPEDRVGVDRGDSRPRGRLRRPRAPDRLRERLALQRDERPRHPPDSGRRSGRPRARRQAPPEGLARRRFAARRRGVATLARRLRAPGVVRRGRRHAPPLDLAAEARLVSFLWRVAPRCSLVHDSAEGGLAVSLAEAALFSGCGAQLTSTTTRSRSSARSADAPCSRVRRRCGTTSARARRGARSTGAWHRHRRGRYPVGSGAGAPAGCLGDAGVRPRG